MTKEDKEKQLYRLFTVKCCLEAASLNIKQAIEELEDDKELQILWQKLKCKP